MRALTALALALALPTLALAAGFGGDAPPTRIPLPAQPFSATVHDLSGTSVRLDRLTWDGDIFVGGQVGQADAAVPFERVKEVRIEPTDDAEKRIAYVVLHSGDSVRVQIDEDLSLYGEATWGNYRIEAKDIARIVVHGPSAPPKASKPAAVPPEAPVGG